MDELDAIMQLENGDNDSALEDAKALQLLIERGTIWSLQGSYGRGAVQAMEAGDVMLATVPQSDYYGNRIPSRDMVEPGSKGSRQLVVDTHGEDWAVTLDMV